MSFNNIETHKIEVADALITVPAIAGGIDAISFSGGGSFGWQKETVNAGNCHYRLGSKSDSSHRFAGVLGYKVGVGYSNNFGQEDGKTSLTLSTFLEGTYIDGYGTVRVKGAKDYNEKSKVERHSILLKPKLRFTTSLGKKNSIELNVFANFE